MWLPVTMTAQAPRRIASRARAGVGRAPQSTAAKPEAAAASATVAAISGLLARRSRPITTVRSPGWPAARAWKKACA